MKITKRGDLAGKRVLVVEDEPLVALDIMEVLDAVGIKGIGPIGSLEEAQRLIETERFDTALVDANLRGRPVRCDRGSFDQSRRAVCVCDRV